ncbi:MAG: wax ester/triacylglycerol synthase family O-acyltransferase [Acidimicrobiia bacterium]|nr:wax ester/triacylglycerol synthase family O-acyltransferase [Acidimicrobiia bacterium]
MQTYERLSFLDTSFLALESRTTHMHVASLGLFDAGPMRDANGGIDIERIRAYVGSRLHLIPRYRQRLAFVPIERHPVWVDDEHFDLEYHVRHTSLPKPGTPEQLLDLAGRVLSQQLDRSKPMWELWVVEGLEDDRFAVISKVHHCMIDGMAGVELMAVLLGMAPTSDIEDAPPFKPRPIPDGAELVVRETARRAGRFLSALRSVRQATGDLQAVTLEVARRLRAISYSLGSGWLSPAAKTPLNGTIGPNRRFATLDMRLQDVKDIKNKLGGTVNDAVLAIVAGAVRRYLERSGAERDDAPFRVMAPVSVRPPGGQTVSGNHVAMWLAELPIDEPDPKERFRLVAEETLKLKDTDQALGASLLVQLSSGAPITLVALGTRLAASARPFNMTVTNIPGPQFPIYLLESEMMGQYPLVPLWRSHGLGIALFSYAGTLMWGFNGDLDVMEDITEFVRCIEESFDELKQL